ncbi:MAG: energy transducer TonB [Pseudomonadales bacterium]|nr:energy transducer TonB [Pseudomonadales bacterium]
MNVFGRYIYTQVGAMLITFVLFLTMQGFLSTGYDVSVGHDYQSVNFIRVKQDTDLQLKQIKPKKPEEPLEEPDPVELDTKAFQAPVDSFDISEVAVKPSFNIEGGVGFGTGDGDFLPMVKVPPQYPRRALRNGIEGWVVVSFTVTSDGSVRSPKVVDSNPKGVFDQSAINAVMKFKYKPRMVAGQAVEVQGVQNKFTFKLKR